MLNYFNIPCGQPKIYEDNLQLNLKFCLYTKSARVICFLLSFQSQKMEDGKQRNTLLTEHDKIENLPDSKLPIQFNKNVQKQSEGTM